MRDGASTLPSRIRATIFTDELTIPAGTYPIAAVNLAVRRNTNFGSFTCRGG
jgi:hypothetical protein